mgnify:FL=1
MELMDDNWRMERIRTTDSVTNEGRSRVRPGVEIGYDGSLILMDGDFFNGGIHEYRFQSDDGCLWWTGFRDGFCGDGSGFQFLTVSGKTLIFIVMSGGLSFT